MSVTTEPTWTVCIDFPSDDGNLLIAEYALKAMLEACHLNGTPPLTGSASYEPHLIVRLTFEEVKTAFVIGKHAEMAIKSFEEWAARHGYPNG